MKRFMQPLPRQGTDRRTVRARVIVAAAMILAVVLAGLDTLAWFRLERNLDQRLDRFAVAARAAGWRFSAQDGGRGGWPLAATLTLLHPSLRGDVPLLPGGIAWSGDEVTLSLSPLHPGRATVLADGIQTLSIAPDSSTPLLLRIWGSRIALRLPPDRGTPAADDPPPAGSGFPSGRSDLLLDAEALHVAVPGNGPDDIAVVTRLSARLGWRPDPPGGAAGGPTLEAGRLSLLLRDIALPARLGAGGGRVVQQARLEARLTGHIAPRTMPADAVAPGQPPGSRLRIEQASLDWGGGGAALGGEASLGADGTASGRFDLVVANAADILRQMRNAGLIDQGTMVAIGAVVGLIEAGQPGPRVHLPLRLQDGMLSLGEIPLLRTGTMLQPMPTAR